MKLFWQRVQRLLRLLRLRSSAAAVIKNSPTGAQPTSQRLMLLLPQLNPFKAMIGFTIFFPVLVEVGKMGSARFPLSSTIWWLKNGEHSIPSIYCSLIMAGKWGERRNRHLFSRNSVHHCAFTLHSRIGPCPSLHFCGWIQSETCPRVMRTCDGWIQSAPFWLYASAMAKEFSS